MGLEPVTWGGLRTKFKLFAIWSISMLIDIGFLVLWVVVVVGSNVYIIEPLKSHLLGVEWAVFHAFQITFAVGTFVPVACFVFMDIRRIILQAWTQK